MRRVSWLALALLGCPGGPAPGECEALASDVRAFANAAIDRSAQGCATHADCRLFRPMLGCYTGCPRAASAARANEVEVELVTVDQSVCGTSTCLITDGCEPVHAECRSGICTALPGAVDGGSPDGG